MKNIIFSTIFVITSFTLHGQTQNLSNEQLEVIRVLKVLQKESQDMQLHLNEIVFGDPDNLLLQAVEEFEKIQLEGTPKDFQAAFSDYLNSFRKFTGVKEDGETLGAFINNFLTLGVSTFETMGKMESESKRNDIKLIELLKVSDSYGVAIINEEVKGFPENTAIGRKAIREAMQKSNNAFSSTRPSWWEKVGRFTYSDQKKLQRNMQPFSAKYH